PDVAPAQHLDAPKSTKIVVICQEHVGAAFTFRCGARCPLTCAGPSRTPRHGRGDRAFGRGRTEATLPGPCYVVAVSLLHRATRLCRGRRTQAPPRGQARAARAPRAR